MRSLSTEAPNPRTQDIDSLDTLALLERLHAEDRSVLDVVQAVLPQLAIVSERVALAFRTGGRLFYAGAGTSGRLGVLDAAECPPTFGTDPELVQGLIAGGYETLVRSAEGVEDLVDEGRCAVDAAGVGELDVLVGISASRRTPYVRGALARARELGVWTAFLVCNELGEDPDAVADLVIEAVTGPEPITGSTRMKAALSQKMILTMLTTSAMVQCGKTLGNLMVDVAPTSQKLIERAKGLVMQLGKVEYEEASALLSTTQSKVKPAVLMAQFKCTHERADEVLLQCDGRLRRAIETMEREA